MFNLFIKVLTFLFPHRWRDLTAYKMFILRTYHQFAGRVWLSYDQAFREHAAATNLSHCSSVNVKLFHFHAAATSTRQAPGEGIQESPEVVGTISVGVV